MSGVDSHATEEHCRLVQLQMVHKAWSDGWKAAGKSSAGVLALQHHNGHLRRTTTMSSFQVID